MDVLIVGNEFGFPYGSGASSRVYAYAKGLQANGARVRVLCLEPSDAAGAPVNTQARGTYRGIEFEYTYGRTSRPASRAWRGVLKAAKWWRFLAAARRWAAGGRADAMIVYTRSISWLVAARLACWSTGALYIHEDCELPFVYDSPSVGTSLQRWLYEQVLFKGFDGCLAISSYLADYCRRRLRPAARVLLVPILVDVDEAGPDGTPGSDAGDHVVYVGYATHPEVLDLVRGFAEVAGAHPELRLRVIGGSNRPHLLPALWDLARRLDVAERIELVGAVKRDELPALLRAARVLVLPRPDAEFSRAGLPTKLGEYLATGRPVVVSAVGDIPSYLQDGVDAYLYEAGDLPAFAARLGHVLDHPAEAALVGRQGRVTAGERFDPATHGARIIAFVEELRRERSARRTKAPR